MSNAQSGNSDGKSPAERSNTVRELIEMFERLCHNVHRDQGLRDAISKVVAAQPASMQEADELIAANAAVVADVLQKLQASKAEDHRQRRERRERQQQQRQLKQQHEEQKLQTQEAQQELHTLSNRFQLSEFQRPVSDATMSTASSAEPFVALAAPQVHHTRFMPDTGLTRDCFCQKLNDLLKMHLFIQRFIHDEVASPTPASNNDANAGGVINTQKA